MNAIIAAFCAAVFIVGEALCEKRINKLEDIIRKQRRQINRYQSRIEKLEDDHGYNYMD